MKKKAIYAKEGEDKTTGDEADKIKNAKIAQRHSQYNPNLKPGQIKTFTGRVVEKDIYEKDMKELKKSLSQKSMLPSLSRSVLSRSQASMVKSIKPNLKGLNPKNTVFLTNTDGSVISVENLSKI
jgi:hypothetical protein